MVKKTRKTTSSKSSSSVTRRVPEFFKIFFSPRSFHKMKVPIEFLEQLTCEIPEIFSLRGQSGKVWSVRLLEMGDGYYFENGWQDFVIDNFMSDQDICVFKYVNDFRLQVQIFEQNGCEKESAFEANCSQASSPRRWRKKAAKNQDERLGGRLMSRRRDITVEEENMAWNAALGFVSRNPYTVITMRNSHVYTGYCLPLPRSFCNEHLPDRSQDMTLRDPRREVWDSNHKTDLKLPNLGEQHHLHFAC
ncbi:hypothetical protein C5167_012475 [Papaver somniferum]|uniref:TF-B3 domain-containing protein n=1 Tax=Papaver somniferum TaxID=3469 RepID=A0A4Y7J0N8_PAPSO|nr:B3 domain-containing protein Os01g0723500-like [Papaver somniferum]RZC53620.1 hypothetical protein C5167_012475 [Papaver somniferum]